MNLERAKLIGSCEKYPGAWMSAYELTWLAERASLGGLIAEVGAWRGRSTRAMADNTTGFIYAVDPWAGDWHGSEDGSIVTGEDVFRSFKQSVRGLSNVSAVRMTSTDAAAFFADQRLKFDMVFIDALHTYDALKADILAWRPLLTDGGLLCGHDYHPDFPGVKQAVEELVPGFQLLGGVAEGTPNKLCSIWWAP